MPCSTSTSLCNSTWPSVHWIMLRSGGTSMRCATRLTSLWWMLELRASMVRLGRLSRELQSAIVVDQHQQAIMRILQFVQSDWDHRSQFTASYMLKTSTIVSSAQTSRMPLKVKWAMKCSCLPTCLSNNSNKRVSMSLMHYSTKKSKESNNNKNPITCQWLSTHSSTAMLSKWPNHCTTLQAPSHQLTRENKQQAHICKTKFGASGTTLTNLLNASRICSETRNNCLALCLSRKTMRIAWC